MLDIAIIGGGATGCALALGLAQQQTHSVMLIDAGEPPTLDAKSIGFDQRTLALSHSSMQVLGQMGVDLTQLTTSPIEHIHVSDQNHAGQTRLHANEHHIDAFGYVVPLAALGAQIYADFGRCQSPTLTYQANTQVTELQRQQDYCQLTLSDGNQIQARLVVLAEGGRTQLAETVGLSRSITDYEQTAITFVVSASESHQGWAYERFTEQGPLALLPLSANQFGVVWTVSQAKAQDLSELADKDFLAALQQAFGYRSGLFSQINERESYPLTLRQLTPAFTHRTVAVGNSAQSLHPIAGQGVNLGFRDIHQLIQQCSAVTSERLGGYTMLSAYQQAREADVAATVGLTDGLVQLFSNGHIPLALGRNAALTGLNLNQTAKNAFARQAMGYKHAAF